MTGKELWEQYQHYTRDFTEHSRTLGFGALGVCWLFKAENFSFPALIYCAMLLVVLYFLCDVSQSLIGAWSIKNFTEEEEAKLWKATGTIDGDIKKPRSVDRPAFICFCLKAAFLISSFLILGAHIVLILAETLK